MAILLVQNKADVYTTEQLEHFKKEMNDAGGFEDLMFLKKALEKKRGTVHISRQQDIENYKQKFLTGIYEPLRKSYNTEVPYVFWGKFYEVINKTSSQKNQ